MRAFFSAVVVLVPACCLQAQQFGSEDLAPYLPSPQNVVERMLEAAQLKAGETLYDLGSGDGRIVITAAQKFGANAVGIEISDILCKSTLKKIAALNLEGRVKIIHGNALKTDLSPADVVTLYLLTSSNARLRPNLEKYLKPTARVVSLNFSMPGWKPARVNTVKEDHQIHTIYVYEMSGYREDRKSK